MTVRAWSLALARRRVRRSLDVPFAQRRDVLGAIGQLVDLDGRVLTTSGGHQGAPRWAAMHSTLCPSDVVIFRSDDRGVAMVTLSLRRPEHVDTLLAIFPNRR